MGAVEELAKERAPGRERRLLKALGIVRARYIQGQSEGQSWGGRGRGLERVG